MDDDRYKILITRRNKLSCTNNILRYKVTQNNWKNHNSMLQSRNVVVLPNSDEMRNTLIDQIHNVSHPGIDETIRRVKRVAWWERMKPFISERVKSCLQCQKVKAVQNPMRPIIITETSEQPFERVQIDLTGPYGISNDRKRMKIFFDRDEIQTWTGETARVKHLYLFTMVDVLSKYVILRNSIRKQD